MFYSCKTNVMLSSGPLYLLCDSFIHTQTHDQNLLQPAETISIRISNSVTVCVISPQRVVCGLQMRQSYRPRWSSCIRRRVPWPWRWTSRIQTSGSKVWVRASLWTPPTARATNRPCAPNRWYWIQKSLRSVRLKEVHLFDQ